MTDVFISYSRKDANFIRTLFDSLKVCQRDAWVDWRGIDYSTHWWEEICAGIDGADNFVLVMSPDSLNSVYCHQEIEHARKNTKRIVPLLYIPIDESALVGGWYTHPELRQHETLARQNWEALKAIQWIDCTQLGTLEKITEALLKTIDTDPERTRLHTRLLLRVRDWESRGRSSSALLRGDELAAFECWRDDSQKKGDEPSPTETQLLYIAESRRAEDTEIARDKQRERRIRQFRVAAVALAAVGVLAVTAALGSFAATTQAQQRADAANTQVGDANATLTLVPQTLAAANAEVISAQGQAATAVDNAKQANTQVSAAHATLTPIPVTLTVVANQVKQSQDLNESLRLAAAANAAMQDTTSDPRLAVLLGIRGLKTAYSPQADAALVQALDLNDKVRVLHSHTSHVESAVFSPDGKTIFVGGGRSGLQYGPDPSCARLFDAASGRELRAFSTEPTGKYSADTTVLFMSVAFSPDGKTVLTANDDSSARLWDAGSGQLLHTLSGHTDSVMSVAFSPDGRTMLTGSKDKTARLWDVSSGQLLQTIGGHDDWVTSVAFSPDGKTVLTGTWDNTARLWDASSGQLLRTLSTQTGKGRGATDPIDHMGALAFSPDGKTVLIGGNDNAARLWDAASGEVLQTFSGHTNAVVSVAFSPDGKTVLTGSWDNTARLWDASSGQALRTLVGHTNYVTSVMFSPDGKTILTGSLDNTVRLWATQSERGPRTLSDQFAITTAFSPDGKTVLTGNWDHSAKLWDVASGHIVRIFRGHFRPVTSVAFSSDGKTVITASLDMTIRLWDVASGQQLRNLGPQLGVMEHPSVRLSLRDETRNVALSPDGRTILAGNNSDYGAHLLDAASGQEVRRLDGHHGLVISVAFSADGETALTGSMDGDAMLWDVASGQARRTLSGHKGDVLSVAFSADGTARLWDVASGQELRTLSGHGKGVMSVAFSPDGKTVLTGSWDNTARLWDATSGQVLRILVGHTGPVASVAFSPDGKTVLTSSQDSTVRLWDSDYHDFIAYSCTRLFGNDFTDDERTQYAIPLKEGTCAQSVSTLATPGRPTVTPLPVWTPIASPTMSPFGSLTVRRPVNPTELDFYHSITNNVQLLDPKAPSRDQYSVTMSRSDEAVFGFGWCAIDSTTVVENWKHMTRQFFVEGEPVPDDQMLEYPRMNGFLTCIERAMLVGGWQIGKTYTMEYRETIDEAINDGTSTYAAGTYDVILTVSVVP